MPSPIAPRKMPRKDIQHQLYADYTAGMLLTAICSKYNVELETIDKVVRWIEPPSAPRLLRAKHPDRSLMRVSSAVTQTIQAALAASSKMPPRRRHILSCFVETGSVRRTAEVCQITTATVRKYFREIVEDNTLTGMNEARYGRNQRRKEAITAYFDEHGAASAAEHFEVSRGRIYQIVWERRDNPTSAHKLNQLQLLNARKT